MEPGPEMARSCLTSPNPVSIVRAMRGQWTRLRVRAAVSGGIVLLLMLLGGAATVAAHSGRPATLSSFERDPVAPQAAPGPAVPAPVTLPPATPPPAISPPSSTAPWVPLALGIVTVLAGVRWPRCPRRRLALTLSLSLAVFACETALHSAHHLNDPKKAEHCAVYSASLHLSGLEAAPATPELPRPLPTLEGVRAHDGQPFARVLDGPPSRAPPLLPA